MSGLSEQILIPSAILTASLIGSAHCVSMCGGLVMAVAPGRRRLGLYHLGRLVSYSALGATSGALGREAFGSSLFRTLPWVTTLVLGAGLIWLGIRYLVGRPLRLALPKFLSWPVSKLMTAAMSRRGSGFGSLSTGLLSTLLPCGWLYTFVLAASATRSATLGAVSLAIFWAGSVPALSLAPYLIDRLIRPLRSAAPKLSGLILIAAGLAAVGVRAAPLFHREPSAGAAPMSEACPMHLGKSR